MRHSWFIAITSDTEAIRRRVPADRNVTVRPLADGRSVILATTPDVVVGEHNGQLTIDPIRDVTMASVDTTTGQTRAWRTLLSVPEVYWSGKGSNLFLGGSLAELLPHIIFRRLEERSIVDHHLFRWIPGARTYIDGVSRLLPGHELHWNTQGPATTRQVQSLSDLTSEERRPINRESVSLQFEALQRHFATHLEYSRDEDRAVLLSGGVDSSLLVMVMQSLDGASSLQTRNFILDTPELLGEDDYCQDAVRIFGTQHACTRFGPADYPPLLIDLIAMIGRPFGHDSYPIFSGFLRSMGHTGPTMLWGGEGADTIYGNWTSKLVRPRYRYFPQPLLWALGAGLQPFLPNKAHGAREIMRNVRALRDETNSDYPENRQARYCDLETVTRWFGERTVEDAMTERRQLTTLLTGYPMSEVERMHAAALFTNSLMNASIGFQIASASGCTLLSPYLSEGVVRAVLRTRPEQRYFYRGQTKPLLKLALQERTGSEFITRPKRDGGFYNDLCTWMRDGVLADMIRSIERPGYVDAKSFQQKLESPDWTTWNLLLMDVYTKHLRSLAGENGQSNSRK